MQLKGNLVICGRGCYDTVTHNAEDVSARLLTSRTSRQLIKQIDGMPFSLVVGITVGGRRPRCRSDHDGGFYEQRYYNCTQYERGFKKTQALIWSIVQRHRFARGHLVGLTLPSSLLTFIVEVHLYISFHSGNDATLHYIMDDFHQCWFVNGFLSQSHTVPGSV